MNNIKVTVDYELPTTDKFDALLEQYLQAKSIAETTKETMTPLIQMGGKARYDAICEQLQVIVGQLKKIALVSESHSSQSATGYYHLRGESYRMCVVYYPSRDKVEITYREKFGYTSRDFLNWEYNQNDLLDLDGLVTCWNNFTIIEDMQKQCNYTIQNMITEQQKKAKKIASTLNKIRE